MSTSPIVISLDGMSERHALALAECLSSSVWGFKINDLIIECGIDIVKKLKEFGNVFADPQFHDIPTSVGNGVARLARAGADLISVHAAGGVDMMKAAADASGRKRILATSILTSLDEEAVRLMYGDTIQAKVLQFARDADSARVSGLVCSPQELRVPGLPDLYRVTPGIKPRWYRGDGDHKRVGTPAQAIADGANLLVIGRPITGADDPLAAIDKTMHEVYETA